ncbi:MAG: (d)CMP kinase [Akkermansia sp.]|nr:(d)CMP kinase [Akkermansia sp.]
MNPPAIAIDGPAASGKSTVAKLIAKELGYTFINTGAMYRAVTWYTLQKGVNPADTAAVEALLPGIPLSFGKEGSNSTVVYEGRVLTSELTEKSTNDNVSAIASIPAVRALLVEKQREYNTREAVVMEGRDIGTVVFPDTKYKYFVTASEEVRAARRAAEGITDSIAERDRKDSQRACAPLKKADDALLVDTSDMSIEQVVAFIAADIRAKLAC